MDKADTVDDVVRISSSIIGNRRNATRLFGSMSINIKKMTDQIIE